MKSESGLTPEEKMIKAKIRMGDDPPQGRPFFAYLVSHLRLIEKKEIPTMGVDANANLYYNPQFVDSLSDDEIYGTLCHECLHCALEHLSRGNQLRQNHELSNISQDIVVNNIIGKDKQQGNGIKLPNGGLIPKDDKLEIYGYNLENIGEKSSEEIYDELYRHFKKELDEMMKQAGKGRFDEHIKSDEDGQCEGEDGKEGNGNGISTGTGKELSKKNWQKILLDALAHSKNKGCVPEGLERLVEKVLEPKVNWRTYLFKWITSMIPTDYTWSFPSRKTLSTGIYLPSTEKESIEIITAIDTSMSITNEELEIFLGELVGITRAFKNVDLTIMDCDADVHGVFEFKRATVSDITKKVKLKGGGGTSFQPVIRWVNKNRPNAKFIIYLTDGYGDKVNRQKYNILWVITKDGSDELVKDSGTVIKLKNY